ncbi:MAG TPA: HPr kinase/phosphatase C-terminal domain-containing protein [Caulobacteraceae bacterium]|nr:HPr kinase/phosphatase C-terminal domain-containing protein [Caulobacteraceae bacterium]
MILHAGLIAQRRRQFWEGVLITGPSGCGKSELALRCVDQGFRLVADDRVLIWSSGGRLWGRAPDALFSLIEARGLGVVAEPALPFCPIGLVVGFADTLERVPEPAFETLLGLSIAKLHLSYGEPSAPAKLRRGINHLG